MKKLLLIVLIFSAFGLKAQDAYNKEDLRKLAAITVDIEKLDRMKMLVTYSAVPEEKEACIKEYDAGISAFMEECEKFYRAEYTPAEVKELVAFFETAAGKKLAQDNMRLITDSFPKGKEWDKQLREMKKANKAKQK